MTLERIQNRDFNLAIRREIRLAEWFFLKDYMFSFELKDDTLMRVKE